MPCGEQRIVLNIQAVGVRAVGFHTVLKPPCSQFWLSCSDEGGG